MTKVRTRKNTARACVPITRQKPLQFQDEGVNLGDKKVTTVNIVGDDVVATRSGDVVTVTHSATSSAEHYRGLYDASGGTYPATGGSTGGDPQAGDHWAVSVADAGFKFPVGSILMALTSSPGQTDSNWRII